LFWKAAKNLRICGIFLEIPVVLVPGVTNAIAVPASQGIRNATRNKHSFWVMTATKRDGSFRKTWKFSKSSATMYHTNAEYVDFWKSQIKYHYIEKIDVLRHYTKMGQPKTNPVVTGILKCIAQSVVDKIRLNHKPVLIVIGGVAEHHHFLKRRFPKGSTIKESTYKRILQYNKLIYHYSLIS